MSETRRGTGWKFLGKSDASAWVLAALPLVTLLDQLFETPPDWLSGHWKENWRVLFPLGITVVGLLTLRGVLLALSRSRGRVLSGIGRYGLSLGAGLGMCWFPYLVVVLLLSMLLGFASEVASHIVAALLGGAAGGIAAQYVSRTRFPIGAVCVAAFSLLIALRVEDGFLSALPWVALSTVSALLGSLWLNRRLRKRFPLGTAEE
ncbi:MAG TPA: hypothetical protein VMZ92_16495 [Planctomycetota bacterium]|nr:hypothetical protein [Planctomycetota bacterium]